MHAVEAATTAKCTRLPQSLTVRPAPVCGLLLTQRADEGCETCAPGLGLPSCPGMTPTASAGIVHPTSVHTHCCHQKSCSICHHRYSCYLQCVNTGQGAAADKQGITHHRCLQEAACDACRPACLGPAGADQADGSGCQLLQRQLAARLHFAAEQVRAVGTILHGRTGRMAVRHAANIPAEHTIKNLLAKMGSLPST